MTAVVWLVLLYLVLLLCCLLVDIGSRIYFEARKRRVELERVRQRTRQADRSIRQMANEAEAAILRIVMESRIQERDIR